MSPSSWTTAIPQFLWRRLGDANGNPLYTYDADQSGKSSCYAECAKEFPPFVADAHAKAAGDFSILVRDDHVQAVGLSGQAAVSLLGQGSGRASRSARAIELNAKIPRGYDPASKIYSPKPGWRRAAYMPEKSIAMPTAVSSSTGWPSPTALDLWMRPPT